MSNIHPQARTTPRIRAEIQASNDGVDVLAARYNITAMTVRKWRNRSEVQDRSHRAHELHTTLNVAQEFIVCELRKTCLLPLDDLVALTQRFVCPHASRSGIARLLTREGLSRLEDLQPKIAAQPAKTFKSYEPGFVHVDIKYLPQMSDEDARRYLFVAIDRATRWVFVRIYDDQSEASSCDFLTKLHQACPLQITKILTDNGSQFTDRFTRGKVADTVANAVEPIVEAVAQQAAERHDGGSAEPICEHTPCKPAVEPASASAPTRSSGGSGRHAFDRLCKTLKIEHRLIRPRHPQTNGMVERFNGRIAQVIKQTRFANAKELESTLLNYVKTYNHVIPQKSLGHKAPIQAMKEWQAKSPHLFTKRVYERAGLDTP